MGWYPGGVWYLKVPIIIIRYVGMIIISQVTNEILDKFISKMSYLAVVFFKVGKKERRYIKNIYRTNILHRQQLLRFWKKSTTTWMNKELFSSSWMTRWLKQINTQQKEHTQQRIKTSKRNSLG